ncbi:hypothetical protein [Desulfonatronum parangueonense]
MTFPTVRGVTKIFNKTYRNHLATSRGIELREQGLIAPLDQRAS